MLGNGDGTFANYVEYDTGIIPLYASFGDFNNDGKLDIVTGGGYSFSVMLGNGNGTFPNHVDYATGQSAYSIAVGDINGDGKLDLAMTHMDNFISIRMGNGDGTFGSQIDYATGNSSYRAVIADLNGDGKQDIATTDYSDKSISVLLSSCSPLAINSFSPGSGQVGASITITGNGFSPTPANNLVTFGGLKANVTAASSTSLTVTVPGGTSFSTISVEVGGYVATSTMAFDEQSATCGKLITKSDYATGSGPESLTTGDLNNDNLLDVVTANSSGTISVLFGTGSGTFPGHTQYSTGLGSQSVALGDFDGNGNQDAVVANSSANTVSILMGNGTAANTFATPKYFTTGTKPYQVAVGDFDGNGIQDIVTANNGAKSVSVLLGTGNINNPFNPKVDYTTGTNPYSVAVGDFNKDMNLDIAVACYGGTYGLSILMGTGSGTFLPQLQYATGSSPASVAVGEFNRDGWPDLVLASVLSSSISILVNSNGTFPTHTEYATQYQPWSVSVADFDGNGMYDVVSASPEAGRTYANSISVFLNINGLGTFYPQVPYTTGNSPYCTVGDFNGDGKHDVATANYIDNTISVLLQNCVTQRMDDEETSSQKVETENNIFAYSEELTIYVKGLNGQQAQIIDIQGRTLGMTTGEPFQVAQGGIYIVNIAGNRTKLLVK